MIQEESMLFKEEEKFIMSEVLDAMKPTFNTKEVNMFNSERDELASIPLEDVEDRRYTEPNAKYIEDFIPNELLNDWLSTKVTFIKAFYHWKAIETESPYGPFSALNVFMAEHNNNLSEKIQRSTWEEDVKYFIKILECETFPQFKIQGTDTMDRRVITSEVQQALGMQKIHISTPSEYEGVNARVMGAYHDDPR